MKQFKNAVAVAIAAAGLVSVSAMAGTAVHWAGSDAGSAKDVKWQVVQPSTLDFSITTANVRSLTKYGEVNEPTPGVITGKIGTFNNAGDEVTVVADSSFEKIATGWAKGDAADEHMLWGCFVGDDVEKGLMWLDGSKPWPAHTAGRVYGYMYSGDASNPVPITDITKLRSTAFTDHITVTKYTV